MKDVEEAQVGPDQGATGKVKGFPSHFVSQETKKGPEWNRAYVNGFLDESNRLPTEQQLLRTGKDYTRYRRLGKGQQSQLPYKELMGLKKEKGKDVPSYRNLSYEILPVVPKIKNVLVNKVMNSPFRLTVKPIDPQSTNERADLKAKMQEFVTFQDYQKRFKYLSGLGLEPPSSNGEPMPKSMNEIDPWLDQSPRDSTAMEVIDYMRWREYYDDWDEVKKTMLGDWFDLGIAGTWPRVDINGVVRAQAIMPERSRCNRCLKADFSDLIRFGQFREVTISELRKMTQGKIVGTKRIEALGEEEMYKDIANSACLGDKQRYMDTVQAYWSETSYSYAYDVERVTIFEAIYSSTDIEVSKTYKNGSGNMRVGDLAFDYVPFKGDKTVNNGKGMSDVEFSKKNPGQKIHRKEVKNVYKCSIVHGTDYVFNYGMLENMPRSLTNPNDTALPVCLYALDSGSIAGLIETVADQVQLNWLQFQSHVSASKPPGIAIEKKALARVALGGKAGKKWDPKEDLMMYAELGSIAYDGYDQHGSPLNHMPIMELKNGLSQGAMEHYNLILLMVEMMRNLVGLNALTEGQTPAERTGKAVAQLSFGASDNALSHIFYAYKNVYKRTSEMAYSLLQSVVSLPNADTLGEALGAESYRFFKLNKEISLRDMAIMIEEGPDEETKANIQEIVVKAIDNKEIDAEDGIMITMEDNKYRAIMQLRKKKREKQEMMQAQQMQLVQQQGAENTKTGVAVEQQKQMSAQAEGALEQQKQQNALTLQDQQSRLKREEEREKFQQELVLKHLELGAKLEESDRDFIISMLELNNKAKEAKQQKQAA